MRLKSLESIGFKSFAERTVLQFTPEITAIVGPNGCGKSNIVDALRWVMGEQSARHLRGHLMEDVIFSGSETHPPTGMAEVSLLFENEDGRGPADYSTLSEIVVTRRLFRSGESEYSINKVPCRLKDIIDLFLGTGVGNKAYSVVEQGRVEEMVSAKPEERRCLIEEAAGTSKYKSRKLAAERKLERTHQNLLRVSDIVREIERQIRSMELQAKKAERYRSFKEALRGKELLLASLQQKGLEEEISRYGEEFRTLEDRSVQFLASLRSKEAEGEEARRALLEAEREISSLQETAYQRRVQIRGEEQKADFLERSQAELEDAREKAQAEVLEMEVKLRTLSLEIEGLQKAGEDFLQLSLFEGAYLQEKEKELGEVKVQIQNAQSGLEREKEILIDMLNRASHWKNERLAATKRREEVEKELSRKQKEHAETVRSLEAWKKKRQEEGATLEDSLARAREIEREMGEATDWVKEWVGVKERQERELETLKEQLHEVRSRLVSLEALQKNYEGYQEGVRAIMFKRQKEAVFGGIYGLVGDVIEAPEPFEKALTAVLGDRLQYIIVQGHEEGLEAIEYLKHESAGRGSFIPRRLSAKRERTLDLTEPEIVAPILELVFVKEGYKEIAEYLLGDVVVVRDLRSGLELWSRNGFAHTLVTPEGEVIDPMGVITGGSEESLEESLLSQKRRMKELETRLLKLEALVHAKGKEVAAVKEQIEQAEARKSILMGKSHRLELERIQLEHGLLQAGQEMARLEETLQWLAQEQGDLVASLQFLGVKILECQTEIEAQLQERADREKELEEKKGVLSRLGGDLNRVESQVTESRIRTAALSERKENARLNLENRITLRDELVERVRSLESQITEMNEKRARIKEAALNAAKSLEEGRRTLKEVEGRLGEARQNYRELSRRLAELEEAVKEIRPLVENLQEEKNRLQILLSERRLNLQHLVESIREKYAVDLLGASFGRLDEKVSRENLQEEIEELRGRLDRMGEVNLTAIGEFEDLNGRYQFSSQQKQDLEKSMADLQRTIAKLNRFCRLRFKESFDEINQRFQEIFTRLFQGGKARLVLADEGDYLETGVDIVAQPPGKKLQSITLLSGGEKALTAVSLLFAIFLTKPSPFCFLDEVDAPLDDANIDRFIELVKEMSRSSQFVLITHNKRTMQAAEVLYGITMEDPGVSRVVSVRMS
ncbi:MAG: chromosome segregation protein SMC [Candidatus Binatia bacterium]